MIAKTVCFSNSGKLSVKSGQLVWSPSAGEAAALPIEDIGMILIESPAVGLSSALLSILAENKVSVVLCDSSHTPSAQMLPISASATSFETTEAQLAASEAVARRLWRSVVRQKIRNQSEVLSRMELPGRNRLLALADATKNGDPSNCEGQAARIYFQALMPSGVTRERFGDWPNAPLNYGYSILRAATARALVSAGLVCFCGIHHHNRYNAFALADDIMEPFRPFVDQYVFGKEEPFAPPSPSLTSEMRKTLLQVLTCDVQIQSKRHPLQIALTLVASSLAKYFLKQSDKILLPGFCK